MEEGAEKHRGWWQGTHHEGEPEPDSFHHLRGPDVVAGQWKWDAEAEAKYLVAADPSHTPRSHAIYHTS